MTTFFRLLSLLPFPILYFLSDLLSGFLHTVVRYRRKTVRSNLTSSFPEKSPREIARIERQFYRFLTDYFLETIKMLDLSDHDIKKRMVIENPEIVDEATRNGKPVTLLLGHYCNWEWVSSLPLWFDGTGWPAQVYHPLHNKAMDRLFMRLRTRFGANNIAMHDIMRRLIDCKRRGIPSVTGFIADQQPGFDIHLFLDFLNHDTGVYTGPERIARFLDSRVLFCHLSRPKRGQYRLRFIHITDTPKELPQFDLTLRYFRLLQENIKQQPAFWLWSHRRWKRSRTDFYRYHGPQTADRLLSHL